MDCKQKFAQGWAVSALMVCALLLAGCGALEKTKEVIKDMTGGTPKPAASAPAAPAEPPTKPPEPEPAAVSPPQPAPPKVDVRHALDQVRNFLDQGQETQAVDELKKVLAAEPENKSGLSFMKQIQEDPKQLYGRQARPYKVVQGDTLATIAQRGMADRDQFYGLARYNGIKAGRDLKVGQLIQVPGKGRLAPPVSALTPTPPPQSAPLPAPLSPAPGPEAEKTLPPAPPSDENAAAAKRKAEIERRVSNARRANAAQDLCGAIREWGAVLALDPEHKTAQYERQRALERKAKLPSSKC